MRAILDLVIWILNLYTYVFIAAVISSWLVAFNIINTRNGFVAQVIDIIHRLTEPVLAPIRKRMPNLGGLDISPIIVLLGIQFIINVIILYIRPNVF